MLINGLFLCTANNPDNSIVGDADVTVERITENQRGHFYSPYQQPSGLIAPCDGQWLITGPVVPVEVP